MVSLWKAAEEGQVRCRDDELERLAETQSVATQCHTATKAETWAVNKGVHYDAWITLSANDLPDVVAAFRDFVKSSSVVDVAARYVLHA
jgi:hypothetical protein